MSLITTRRVLAAKIETTAGTAISMDATNATMNCYDVQIQADIAMIDRPGQSAFSHLPAIHGQRYGEVTFRTDLCGNGAGGIPVWASTFLPACGMVANAQVYTPRTEAPGSNVKTLTIEVQEGAASGVRKRIAGAVGTFRIPFNTGEPTFIEFTFRGIWLPPDDDTMYAPTYVTDRALRFANTTFTIGGSTPPCMQNITIDLGNELFVRPCPTSSAAGLTAGLITRRKVMGTMNPDSVLVATNDQFGKWLSGTEEALSIALTDGTDTITIAAPKIQRTNIQEGDRSGVQIDDISFQCNRSASAGDDELSITFA